MTNWRQRWIVPVIAMIWLTGCARAASECPPLITYSDEFSAQLADEIEALPEGTAIEQAVADYLVTRNMLRAC